MCCRQQLHANRETKWKGAGAAQLRLQQVTLTGRLLLLVPRIGLLQDLTLVLTHQ